MNTEDMDPGYTFSALKRPHQLVKRVSYMLVFLMNHWLVMISQGLNGDAPIRHLYHKLGVLGSTFVLLGPT